MNLFNFLHQDDYESVLRFLKNEEFTIYLLEGEKIRDMTDFFKESAYILPQPEDRLSHCWNSLSDNLWECLPSGNCAILWKDCSYLMNSDMDGFMLTFDVFVDIARQRYVHIRPENRSNLLLLFFDYGNGFKRFQNK